MSKRGKLLYDGGPSPLEGRDRHAAGEAVRMICEVYHLADAAMSYDEMAGCPIVGPQHAKRVAQFEAKACEAVLSRGHSLAYWRRHRDQLQANGLGSRAQACRRCSMRHYLKTCDEIGVVRPSQHGNEKRMWGRPR